MASRRDFLAAGALALAACKGKPYGAKPPVSPAEDLMREHGVVERVLLVLDACAARFDDARPPFGELDGAADVIRRFVEDYHELLEEQYVFPRFRRKGMHDDLVETLLVQHRAGRVQTDLIIDAARARLADGVSRDHARRAIDALARMYRPHAAREDTVLFPDLPEVANGAELAELADRFEHEERERFGPRGFESIVDQVGQLERALDIFDLARFTPAIS
jgi:hemerythrin-like domain-containing protein